jgi:tRNA(Ile)-lysidine synthase TilS/MesJ
VKLQQVLNRVCKAVEEYRMIEEGDRIAVGVSGGKDSLTLLYALAHMRRFFHKKFELEAVTVDLGFPGMDFSPVAQLCGELGVNYTVVETRIADIVLNGKKEGNPCSLCAKLRRGSLNEKAKELGCNKTAYAHNFDDVIETMLLCLFYEGRFSCFLPVTRLDKTGLVLIRPLIYVREADIKGFRNRYHLPVVESKCPVAGRTKRQYVKDLVRTLQADIPDLKKNLFHAVKTSSIPGWVPEERAEQR